MIKKLTINDVDYIEQIFNLEKDIFKNSAFSKESTENLVKADNSFIYAYLIDEKVCGYLMVLDSIDVYEILAIATVEEYRNKGIAQELLDKIKELKSDGKEIQEVYTPFYVHGLAEALGLKRTRLGKATFLYGLIGLFFGCWLTYFTMIKDWPMDIGGKPNATFWQNLPAFVPVIFELVVYFAAHLLVISFFIRSRLYPFKKAENPIKKSSDDKFVIQVRDKK